MVRSLRRLPYVTAATLGATALLGCSGVDRTGDSPFEAYDSASARVVINHRPEWDDSTPWRVSAEPTVVIGGPDVDEPYALFRVVGVQETEDGRIVVANRSSQELRVYGADGTYLERIGQRGEGPGEFLNVGYFKMIRGDTMVVYDSRLDRLTFFAADGSLARMLRVDVQLPGAGYGTEILEDGTLLSATGEGFGVNSGTGRARTTYTLWHVDPYAGAADSLGSWPGTEMYVETSGTAVAVRQGLLARNTYFSASDSTFVLGTNDDYTLERRGIDGTLRILFRTPTRLRPVDDAIVPALIEERLAGIANSNQRRRARAAYEEMEIPETVPAFSWLLLDESGHVWVRPYPLPGDTTLSWDVFRPDGRWLGSLDLPADFYPRQIGPDYILGQSVDELRVERVERYGLTRR